MGNLCAQKANSDSLEPISGKKPEGTIAVVRASISLFFAKNSPKSLIMIKMQKLKEN